MFLVDEPYVSEFFKSTVKSNSIPVVRTGIADSLSLHDGTTLVSERDAVISAKDAPPRLYTTSENAISWINENLGFTGIPDKIELFKNKLKFRKMTEALFPGFFYKEVSFDGLRAVEPEGLPFPFIIKPAVGFFSMGVQLVAAREDWGPAVDAIEAQMAGVGDLYPGSVLDSNVFIIEECIAGNEFAVDAYFNDNGTAVILNILEHRFSSAADVGDRVYSTSKRIIEDNLSEFTDFLNLIGRASGVRNFPVHVELRRNAEGALLPIEVNPMRFGGWCTTADLAAMAYGFNPYLYYFKQQVPNWASLLTGMDGSVFSIIVLDNSTGIDGGEISAFDYEKLLGMFKKPAELRRIDYRAYPVFGFLFTETAENNQDELDYILGSDLKEFVIR